MTRRPVLTVLTALTNSSVEGVSTDFPESRKVVNPVCPRCQQRERAVTRTGKPLPYCRTCWNDYFRAKMRERRIVR